MTKSKDEVERNAVTEGEDDSRRTRSRMKEKVAGRGRGLGRVVGRIVVEMRGKDWD